MLTEEQIIEIAVSCGAHHSPSITVLDCVDLQELARAIEQAVRKEMEGVLNQARAHIVWLAFGECRSPGWDGAPPTAKQAVDAIDAARGQT